MSIKRSLWQNLGSIAYHVLMPLIRVYATHTKPRARVLIICNGEVLVVKNWLGGDGWALPGGGLEQGEAPASAAVRELDEELGLQLTAADIKDLGEYSSVEKGGLITKYYLYSVELAEQPELKLRKYEIMDAQWIEISKLQGMKVGVSSTVRDSLGVWLGSADLV